jgi:hypothetical protein
MVENSEDRVICFRELATLLRAIHVYASSARTLLTLRAARFGVAHGAL